MPALLHPPIRLSRALGFRRKFLLIFLLAIVPSTALLLLGAADRLNELRRDQAELAGMQELAILGDALNGVTRHRRLTLLALGGDTSVGNGITEAASKTDTGLAALQQALTTPSAKQQLGKSIERWQKVRDSWKGMSKPDNVAAHQQLIAELGSLRYFLGGHSGLLHDPYAGNYFSIDLLLTALPPLREGLVNGRTAIEGLASGNAKDRYLGQLDRIVAADLPTHLSRVQSDLALLQEDAPATAAYLTPLWDVPANCIRTLQASASTVMQAGDSTAPDSKAYFQQTSQCLDQIDQFARQVSEHLVNAGLKPRMASARTWMIIYLVLGCGSLLLVGWIVTGFARDIADRVQHLKSVMTQIARGELNIRARMQGRDEMSAIANDTNLAVEEIGNLLRLVKESADHLGEAAVNLTSTSDEIATATTELSSATAAIAANTEAFAESIHQVRDEAKDAQHLVGDAANLSTEGSQAIKAASSDIRRLAETVQDGSDRIGKLQHHADEIAQIVVLIKEIADQTNLLALNAAIEAARAGESGRGFAVVADEVRKLAERTGNSTTQIAGTIGKIKEEIGLAVAVMESSVSEVGSSVALTERADDAIGRIRQDATMTAQAVGNISQALQGQSALASDVGTRIESIARMAEATQRSAQHSAAISQRLRQLADSLQQRLGHFSLT